MRIALLRHMGVVVPADSAKRLTALRQLLSNPDPIIARNALRLLEFQTRDYRVDFLWNFPPAQQNRLWNALVADHALSLQDTPTLFRISLKRADEPGETCVARLWLGQGVLKTLAVATSKDALRKFLRTI